jgi:transcriptional regulator with GAF, ATPase, and Fis domain
MASLIRLDTGQVFNISNKIDIIGRGSTASIFLDEDGVSRNHAEVFMMSGVVEVIDLNSRNGILVNGQKVRKSFLNLGDKLSIGSVDLVYSNETLDTNQTINIAHPNMRASETASILHTSASGRFEIMQVKSDESLMKSGRYSLSARHLEILFKTSLEFNLTGGSDRFLNTVYNTIQKTLTPATLVIKLGNDYIVEKPLGAKNKIAKELFNHSLTQGVAYLRKRSTGFENQPSAITCPILDSNRLTIGAIYLEAMHQNFEPEDLLFVRALAAQASGITAMEAKVNRVDSIGSQFHPEDLLIIGTSEPVIHLKTRIEELASEHMVMISGPPGTERRVIANNIHCMSDHSNKPFVYVDCSALNEAVLHESLFGRTGISDGKFGQADGGTLFLNRLTCLPQEIQELLHLYLQTSSIVPMGVSEPRKVNVQLILGVRGRPEDAVKRQILSEDLLRDMQGKRIHIPHLKDRKEDILEIAEHYFERFTKKYRKVGMHMAPSTKKALYEYPWPGNDRELDLVMERAILCCDHKELPPEYLALPGNTGK